jgi:hypothetical protein
VSEEGRGSTGKASEILRRRGDRTSKLQRTIDRGSPRSKTEESAGEEPVLPSDEPDQTLEQGRPTKPVRITVDLNTHQHRFLREYCLNTGTKGTEVLRGLLSELAQNEELRSRLAERLRR